MWVWSVAVESSRGTPHDLPPNDSQVVPRYQPPRTLAQGNVHILVPLRPVSGSSGHETRSKLQVVGHLYPYFDNIFLMLSSRKAAFQPPVTSVPTMTSLSHTSHTAGTSSTITPCAGWGGSKHPTGYPRLGLSESLSYTTNQGPTQ